MPNIITYPRAGGVVDEDVERMSREQLIAEAKKLRAGIRAHRDGTGHELCWHHPALWRLLPEKTDPLPTVPTWPEFLRGCLRYRQSLDEQLPDAPRVDEPYQSDRTAQSPRIGTPYHADDISSG